MEIKRSVRTFEKIGDNIFPIEYYDDGMIIIDYPTERVKKITEQGRENIEKINKFFSEFRKKNNIKIVLGEQIKNNTDGTEKS